MERRMFIKRTIMGGGALFVGQYLFSDLAFADNVKITPGRTRPGHGFTVHDVPSGRLVDGSQALFVGGPTGETYRIFLDTHSPYKSAHGTLPAVMSGGMYTVLIVNNLGEFNVGDFVVDSDATYQPPSIQPQTGPVGTSFTIVDEQRRLQSGDQAFFYPQGGDPITGIVADNNVVASDMQLEGNVPVGLYSGVNYAVSVRASLTEPPRFEDLLFLVA